MPGTTCGAVGVGRSAAADGVGVREHRCVRLLNHEERNVLKGLAEVESVASAEDEAALAADVVREADAGAEVQIVVLGQTGVICHRDSRGWACSRSRTRVRWTAVAAVGTLVATAAISSWCDAAVGLLGDAVGVDVAVIAETEVQQKWRG